MRIFRLIDDWLTRPRRLPPMPQVPQEDIRTVKKAVPWMFWVAYVALALFLCGVATYYLFFRGPQSPLTDPRLQQVIPTVAPTLVERTIDDPWKNHEWLSQAEARSLRGKANVVNLALLDGGSAHYSTKSAQFETKSPWVRQKAFGITNLSVVGTGLELVAGQTYHLNVLQPFVLKASPQVVYVVTGTGELWQAQLENVKLVEADEVSLPFGIAPNPNLSFTH